MKITLVECEWMEDWYTIERAEHDGREWLEQTSPTFAKWMASARISDASVEGPLEEMRAIAAAIRQREHVLFRRCAVDATKEPVRFWSPRNSQVHGETTLAEADELATQIEAMT